MDRSKPLATSLSCSAFASALVICITSLQRFYKSLQIVADEKPFASALVIWITSEIILGKDLDKVLHRCIVFYHPSLLTFSLEYHVHSFVVVDAVVRHVVVVRTQENPCPLPVTDVSPARAKIDMMECYWCPLAKPTDLTIGH